MPLSTICTSKMGKKRKCLSLDTKVAIIRQVKEGKKPKQAIAAEHDIPASTLSTILKNSDKILAAWEANREGQRKKMRLSPYDDVEKAVYAWFVETRTTQNQTSPSPDDADGSPTDDRQFRNVWDSVSPTLGCNSPSRTLSLQMMSPLQVPTSATMN